MRDGWADLGSATVNEKLDAEFEMAFSAIERTLTGYVNGKRVLQAEYDIPNGQPLKGGNVSIGGTANNIGRFRDIDVQILDTR
jgi:hypothetical protein